MDKNFTGHVLDYREYCAINVIIGQSDINNFKKRSFDKHDKYVHVVTALRILRCVTYLITGV